MSLEQNLDAARAANALVNSQLEIRSSNRPTDKRPDNFMNGLQGKKDELADDLAGTKRLARERIVQEQIVHQKSLLTTKSVHQAALRRKQLELTKNIENLQEEQRKKVQAEAVALGQQASLVMGEENSIKKEIKKLEDEYQSLLTGELNQRENIEVAAQASVDLKMGNCDEMSSIAYLFLRSTAIRPIDLFETGMVMKGHGDEQFEDKHQFVVIGRGAQQNQNDPSQWSKDAVVCDPWENAAYQAADLHHHLKLLGYPPKLGLRMRDESPVRDADEP